MAGGPTPEWGGGGMARGTAAAPLYLPMAPGDRDNSDVFPPSPAQPLGGAASMRRLDGGAA